MRSTGIHDRLWGGSLSAETALGQALSRSHVFADGLLIDRAWPTSIAAMLLPLLVRLVAEID